MWRGPASPGKLWRPGTQVAASGERWLLLQRYSDHAESTPDPRCAAPARAAALPEGDGSLPAALPRAVWTPSRASCWGRGRHPGDLVLVSVSLPSAPGGGQRRLRVGTRLQGKGGVWACLSLWVSGFTLIFSGYFLVVLSVPVAFEIEVFCPLCNPSSEGGLARSPACS